MNEPEPQEFQTTVMSMIRGVGQPASVEADRYVEQFFRYYRAPIHNYLCRTCRLTAETADDVLQQFLLEKLLCADESKNIAHRYLVKRSSGENLKFRGYLLRSLRNFVSDLRRKRLPSEVSLDAVDELRADPAAEAQEELKFSAEWATHLLREAMQIVRERCLAQPNQETIWLIFEARVVRPAESDQSAEAYKDLANRLQLSSPKQASNQLQTAFRKLRAVLRQLISSYLPVESQRAREQIEEELGELMRAAAYCRKGVVLLDTQLDETHFDSVALMEPEAHADDLWSEDDYPGIWRHLHEMPLDALLAEFDPTLAKRFADVDIWMSHPLNTLEELWMHPASPLDILQSLKSFTKRGRRSGDQAAESGNGLPTKINAALYLACLATAWIRHQTRITRDSDERFVSRLNSILANSWLQDPARAALQEWLRQLQSQPPSA